MDLVYPLYDSKYIELFSQLCTWAVVDPEDIDDDKYQFAKKLSEVSLACSFYPVFLYPIC